MVKNFFPALAALALLSCARVSPPVATSYPPYQKQIVKEEPLPTASHRDTIYTIKKGDSLWKIASRYRISLPGLMSVNPGINPKDLKIGQKIIIPKASRIPSSPFIWPVRGEILNSFGERVDGLINQGINFIALENSREIFAAAAGKVIFADDLKGWGKTIVLSHNQDIYTVYANLDSINVKEGSLARKGDIIAQIAAGKNKKYILHFEMRRQSVPEDPLKYIN